MGSELTLPSTAAAGRSTPAPHAAQGVSSRSGSFCFPLTSVRTARRGRKPAPRCTLGYPGHQGELPHRLGRPRGARIPGPAAPQKGGRSADLDAEAARASCSGGDYVTFYVLPRWESRKPRGAHAREAAVGP